MFIEVELAGEAGETPTGKRDHHVLDGEGDLGMGGVECPAHGGPPLQTGDTGAKGASGGIGPPGAGTHRGYVTHTIRAGSHERGTRGGRGVTTRSRGVRAACGPRVGRARAGIGEGAETGAMRLTGFAKGLVFWMEPWYTSPEGREDRARFSILFANSRSLMVFRYRCVNGDHTHAVMTQVGGLQGLRRRPRFLGRYSLSSLHSGFPHI